MPYTHPNASKSYAIPSDGKLTRPNTIAPPTPADATRTVPNFSPGHAPAKSTAQSGSPADSLKSHADSVRAAAKDPWNQIDFPNISQDEVDEHKQHIKDLTDQLDAARQAGSLH